MNEELSDLSPEAIAKSERLAYLIAGFIRHTLTLVEQDELDSWVAESDDNVLLFEELIDEKNLRSMVQKIAEIQSELIWSTTQDKIKRQSKPDSFRLKFILSIAVAASVLAVVATLILFLENRVRPSEIQSRNAARDIAPGSNKAMLILSDGSTIELDQSGNDRITKEAGVAITREDSSKIAYPASDRLDLTEKYNTLRTPRGGQFQLILPDGTKVWLNAASSIRYPLSFGTDHRTVELSGEAYFEVTKNPAKPFHVLMGDTRIEVLGTHFNVNAYADEDRIKTTLLEGSIRIRKEKQTVTIKPLEQAEISVKAPYFHVTEDINAEEAVAWKNGLFQFDHTGLKEILQQLSRWYDVDIQYDLSVDDKTFSGKISRESGAAEVLSILQTAGVHFKIQGNKIEVMK